MKINTPTVIKSLVLFVFWLVFPPLFLLFSFIWKIPRLAYRFIFTLLAPVTLFFLFLCSIMAYVYYDCFIVRGSRTEIETKTGLDFPDYRTVERRRFEDYFSFNGDYTITFSVKIDTVGIQDFYNQIEKQIELHNKEKREDSNWDFDIDGNYSFSSLGIYPDIGKEESLQLTIDKKNSIMEISYGDW